MSDEEMRVKIKRSTKKKSGYEVEKRDDGFYYREFGVERSSGCFYCYCCRID
jgi:hypothetical protein